MSVNIDFNNIKAALKTALSSSGALREIDFDGSNAMALLDALAYDTLLSTQGNFLVSNESFLTSARIWENAALRASEYGYLPRSFVSARAIVSVEFDFPSMRSPIAIPAGTPFSTKVGNQYFTFTTTKPAVATFAGQEGTSFIFQAEVELVEGVVQTASYAVSSDGVFEIPDNRVDMSSLIVWVTDGVTGDTTTFTKADKAIDAIGQNVFFTTITPSGAYGIYFGNGVLGNVPADGSIVSIQYRRSSGELANGASSFTLARNIEEVGQATVNTIEHSVGGQVRETLASIQKSAVIGSRAKETCVTPQEFRAAILNQFPLASDVMVTGGEEMNPPKLGTVALSVVGAGGTRIPSRVQNEMRTFLAQRANKHIVFVQPTTITADVVARLFTKSGNSSQHTAGVIALTQAYGERYLNIFGSEISVSKMSTVVDSSSDDIRGSELSITLKQKVDLLPNLPTTVRFNNEITSVEPVSFQVGRTWYSLTVDADQVIATNMQSGDSLTLGTFTSDGVFSLRSPFKMSFTLPLTVRPKNEMIVSGPNTILSVGQVTVA